MTQQPCAKVVFSIDFELRWGMHDVHGMNVDGQRRDLEGGREMVPRLLALLAGCGIRATWATVGAVGCYNWDEFFQRAPPVPHYANPAFAIKPQYADLDPHGRLHFAPELVRAVLATPGQELGTHTFTHIFMREPGVTAEDVRADLRAVAQLYHERFGVRARALTFPRNQSAFLEVIRDCGIEIWRGNPAAWYHECEESRLHRPLPRALKLLDSLYAFNARRAQLEGDMVRASVFLRLNLPEWLWSAHVRRIETELAHARPGEILHLWFHPHNIGGNPVQRLRRLERILHLVAEYRERGTVASCAMGDLVESAAALRPERRAEHPRSVAAG